ncbi:MAG: ATP-binding cassette domain-containing protein [Propionibacteriales bacterium]|nr:ATP-binding cassette domain-containing protein [Propionibacteriales bacterium]
MFELESVTKRFRDGTVAVDDLTLTIPTGRITVFVGPSGCGKTTTLRMLNRMVEPTSGEVRIDGEPLRQQRRTRLRRRMGYVIQSGGLFPHRTVVDNIQTVPKLLGWSAGKARSRARDLLSEVGLDQRLADRYPHELSGGQQQRVGVARALAADPDVLLMDEPFSAVDPVVRGDLQDMILKLQDELGKTVVMITHDIDEAVKLGDQVAIMGVGGRLAQFGTPIEVLNSPSDEFVEAFIGRDRGYRALSFAPADDLGVERIRVVRTPSAVRGDDHALVLDSDARPIGWVTPERPGRTVPLGGSFVPGQDSLRVALDAALASPVGFAVSVDPENGRYTGAVPLETIMKRAARLRRRVAREHLDAQEAEARRLAEEKRREEAEQARRLEAARAQVLADLAGADDRETGRRRKSRTTEAVVAAAAAEQGVEPKELAAAVERPSDPSDHPDDGPTGGDCVGAEVADEQGAGGGPGDQGPDDQVPGDKEGAAEEQTTAPGSDATDAGPPRVDQEGESGTEDTVALDLTSMLSDDDDRDFFASIVVDGDGNGPTSRGGTQRVDQESTGLAGAEPSARADAPSEPAAAATSEEAATVGDSADEATSEVTTTDETATDEERTENAGAENSGLGYFVPTAAARQQAAERRAAEPETEVSENKSVANDQLARVEPEDQPVRDEPVRDEPVRDGDADDELYDFAQEPPLDADIAGADHDGRIDPVEADPDLDDDPDRTRGAS